MMLYPVILKDSAVIASGAANVNSVSYFSRHLRTGVPHEPLRPTSNTLGHDTADGVAGDNVNEQSVSNMRESRTAAEETCGLLDI